ncbi:hypothetical protein VTN02DRAFT_548 [Thermoascus thermophilus]
MALLTLVLVLVSLSISPVLATTTTTTTTLYASHYNGHVYALSLSLDSTDNDNSGKEYSLTLAASLRTCSAKPSWLTFDPADRTLYCTDEPFDEGGDGGGTLTALSAGPDGTLTELATTRTVEGGVSSVIYSGADGARRIAIAHYQGSALSTFALPLTPDAPAIQTFTYTLPQPGPDAARQDAPHPHQVFLDPTGSFLLSPDLGSDVVRVYAIDPLSDRLTECPGIAVAPGSGPRHGVFWNPDASLDGETSSSPRPPLGNPTSAERSVESTMLYLVSELGNTVSAYAVSYDDAACLAFNETQSLSPYPDGRGVPSGANVAEARVRDRSLYVSVRSDHAFPPDDSLATLALSREQRTVEFRRLTPSYGTVPRTLVINRAGDLVAVGNQASSDVAIIRRDPRTGELGEQVARLHVGEPGTPGTTTGLSSVVWGE